MATISAVYIVPIYLVIVNSFKPSAEAVGDPLGLDLTKLTLENYQAVLNSATFNVTQAYLFTGLVTLTGVISSLLVGAMLAYVIVARAGRTFQLAYILLVAGLIIPPQVVIIPLVKILAAVGLLFSFPGLVLVNAAGNLSIVTFVYVAFLRTVPKELGEAAAIDGAGMIRTFWQIIFPVILPATATLFVLLSVFTWNDFVTPQLILGSSDNYTVTTGIYRAIGTYQTDYGLIFAYVCLASAPMALLYLVAQRYIVGGLTGGAVK